MRISCGILLITLLMMFPTSLFASSVDPVADCPPGLVCFTPDEAIALREQNLDLRALIVELRREVGILKARATPNQSLSVGYLATPDLAGFGADYEYRFFRMFYAGGGFIADSPYARAGVRFNF